MEMKWLCRCFTIQYKPDYRSEAILLALLICKIIALIAGNTLGLQNNHIAGHNNLHIHLFRILQEHAVYFSSKFALQVARKNFLV